jgi:hypothetical protein
MYGKYSLASREIPKYAHKYLVTFSDNDRTTWAAHVNTTQSSRAFTAGTSTPSTTNLLCLKEGTSVTKPVAFTGMNTGSGSGADAGTITDAWWLYGSTVFITQPNGNFYAKSTGKQGWYQLVWSTSEMAGLEATPLVLRTDPLDLT